MSRTNPKANEGREMVADTISRRGRDRLRCDGPNIDLILAAEIACPNSDNRHGVAFIARPPRPLCEWIAKIQDRLRTIDPSQYFYPASDLHSTLVAVCFAATKDEVSAIVEVLRRGLESRRQVFPMVQLTTGRLGFDRNGGAALLIPTDESLEEFRASLIEFVFSLGLEIKQRYVSEIAHVTFVRYLHEMTDERLSKWVEILDSPPECPIQYWHLEALWLSWGRDWYGRSCSIEIEGPYISH